MISSLGSLRRTKSSSSALSRRSGPALRQPGSNANLSGADQRCAQTAAHLAYERYVDVVVPDKQQEQRQFKVTRRSTVGSMSEPKRSMMSTSKAHYSVPSNRSSLGEDVEVAQHRANDRLPGLASNRSESHQSKLLNHISEEIDAENHSVRAAITDQPKHPEPSGKSALSRSHSMRRTLRSSEPKSSASIASDAKFRPSVPADDKSSLLATSFAPVALRRSKSLHTWRFGHSRAMQQISQEAPARGQIIGGRAEPPPSPAVATDGPRSTDVGFAAPSIGAEDSTSFEENKVRRRTSFLSLPFWRRADPVVSLDTIDADANMTGSYPTSGRPRQLEMSETSMRDDGESRAQSAASSRRPNTIARQFKRYFSKTSRTPKQDSVPLENQNLVHPKGQLERMDPSSIANSYQELVEEFLTDNINVIHEPSIRASSHLEDPFRIGAALQHHSSGESSSRLFDRCRANNGERVSSPAVTLESCTSHSRVTSWTDSTITSAAEERLSVIAEDDVAQNLPHKDVDSIIAAHRQDHGEQRQSPKSATLNLVPEIDLDDSLGLAKSYDAFSTLSSWRSKPTIRSVQDQHNTKAMAAQHESVQDELRAKHDSGVTNFIKRKPVPLLALRTNFENHSLTLSPSAEVRAQRAARANSRWTSPLVESQGLFFPRSPVNPGRKIRPQKEMHENERESLGKSSASVTPTSRYYKSPSATTPIAGSTSPSVYSQASGFHPSPSVPLHAKHGFATIVSTRTYSADNSPEASRVRGPRRTLSPNWTQWLEDKVADLAGEVSDISFDGLAQNALSSTPLKHKREGACIEEPESLLLVRPCLAASPSAASAILGSTKTLEQCLAHTGDPATTDSCATESAKRARMADITPKGTVTSSESLMDHIGSTSVAEPSSIVSESSSLRDHRITERLRRRSLLYERSRPSFRMSTSPVSESEHDFSKTSEMKARCNPSVELYTAPVSHESVVKALRADIPEHSDGDHASSRSSQALFHASSNDIDQSGRHVSKIPLPSHTLVADSTTISTSARTLSRYKENAPRSPLSPPVVAKYVLTPRLMRTQSASPITSQTRMPPSPLRISPQRSQTSGQMLANKNELRSSSPSVIHKADGDLSESTLMFI